MPFDKRLDYAIVTCLVLFAGYTLPLLATLGLLRLFSMDGLGDVDFDDVWLPTLMLVVFALGASALLGAMVGALVLPASVVRRVHWLVCLLMGWVIAKVSMALLFFTDWASLDVGLFLATFLAGGFMALLVRTVAMSAGWARHWYPASSCQACGYDLRVTPISEPCPECGEPRPKPGWSVS